MSYIIDDTIQQKSFEFNKKSKALFTVNAFLQLKHRFILVSKTNISQIYIFIVDSVKFGNVQIIMENEISDKNIKFKFKPIFLLNPNKQLVLQSQRSIIELNCRILKRSSHKISNFYRYFIDKAGHLFIQITYSIQQFMNQVHVNYILTKTFQQVNQILQEKLEKLLTYLDLQNFHLSKNDKSKNNNLKSQQKNGQDQLSLLQKFKSLLFLNQIYKIHRVYYLENQSNRSHESEFDSSENSVQLNTINQQKDISIMRLIQKNQQNMQKKVYMALLLICGSNRNHEKKQRLSEQCIFTTQRQLESHMKQIKKRSLVIYQQNNRKCKIIRGIDNHKSLHPQRVLNQNGAHSTILVGTYRLDLSQSLFTYKRTSNEIQIPLRSVIKQLVCKKIKNNQVESSINSFKNQVDFLFFVKDRRNQYVASYFLPMNRNKTDLDQIYMDFYQKNLKEYLIERTKSISVGLKFKDAILLCENILFGLYFLVQNGILHRDLKPQNIMLTKSMKPKLIDFGSCCPIYNRPQFQVTEKRILTTLKYQMPYSQTYAILKKKYTKKQYDQHLLFDVYSFGIIVDQIMQAVSELEYIGQQQGLNLKEIIHILVQRCKEPDPIDRVTFDELFFYIKLLKQIVFIS